MVFWQVRGGAEGEQERGAQENNIITIGWNKLPDLSTIMISLRLNNFG